MEFDQTLKSWRQTFELFFQKRSQMWGPKSLLSSEPVYWFALSIPYRKWSHTLCPKREISYDILVKHAYQLLLLHAGSWWSTKFTCLILSDFGDIVAKSFSFVSFRTSSFTWSNHHLPPPFATTFGDIFISWSSFARYFLRLFVDHKFQCRSQKHVIVLSISPLPRFRCELRVWMTRLSADCANWRAKCFVW